VDLVGELALAPGVDLAPAAATLGDGGLDAVDDLAVPLLGDLRLDHQHDLVRVDPDHLLRTVRPRRAGVAEAMPLRRRDQEAAPRRSRKRLRFRPEYAQRP